MIHSGKIYPNSHVPLRHILLVEDDKHLGIIIRKQLEQTGLRCSVAENGIDAQLHLLRNRKDIHLVMTDYHMPRMDGVGLI